MILHHFSKSIDTFFVNGKRNEVSIKELTNLRHPNPLDVSKRKRFDLPTGEGAPSKIEGVGGVFLWGLGKFSLVGLGKAQGFIRYAEFPVRAHSLR
ncbi:hypothetical protein CN561_00280 [Bacillus toyonensis]|nr:hypothetical protein CN561_00280 [Bacillus toyonensis]